jgi:arginyl-tRNA synthetase
VLNFDGETAPYVQYTYARCASILRKGGLPDLGKADLNALSSDEAYETVKCILAFEDAVRDSAKLREPCMVTRHIVDLAEKFNRFYIKDRIVVDDEGVKNARLLLTQLTGKTLKAGLNLLGINAPESM